VTDRTGLPQTIARSVDGEPVAVIGVSIA